MSQLGFRTALSALSAAQHALQTVGHNIANAATPGYSRQEVYLQNRLPTTNGVGLHIGTGVEVGSVSRVVDSILQSRIRNQSSEVGRQAILAAHLTELEDAFGEPGVGGLNAITSAFFAEISGLTSTPEDPALRTAVTQRGVSLADRFNTLRRQLRGVEESLDNQIRTEVGQINSLTRSLADINVRITAAGLGGNIPPDLQDRQGQLLEALSEHLDINVQNQPNGKVVVSTGGQLLVGASGQANQLQVSGSVRIADGIEARIPGATAPLDPANGSLRALLDIAEQSVDDRINGIDRLAANFITTFNRLHATGVPVEGGFTELASTNTFVDRNANGTPLDERLNVAGLPFEISNGRLQVNVTDDATGVVTRTTIDVNPSTMTVGDLRTALNSIPNLNAVVDAQGHLRLNSAQGYRFDFSNRIPPFGDVQNTFGAAEPVVAGGTAAPFAFNPGDTFSVSVNGAPAQAINLSAGPYANPLAASAQETAAVINSQLTGAVAEVVDGRIAIRSTSPNSPPTYGTLQITDGAGGPAAQLGLSTGVETGTSSSVTVSLGGSYEGTTDEALQFTPLGDGEIGVTPGLQVAVTDSSGNLVATLDVGQGYETGTDLTFGEGLTVSFGAGNISAASGDRFQVDLVANSDTADVLAATGLGGFFTGYDARTIGVNEQIQGDSRLFTAGLQGGAGDNANLLRLLGLTEQSSDGIDGLSHERFYERIITDLAVESGRAQNTKDTQEIVLQSLQGRRDQISGVNLDEELLKLEEFEQAYQVAARYLQTMQEVNDVLASLLG